MNNIEQKPLCIGCFTPFQLLQPKSWLNWAIRAFTRDLQKTGVGFDHILSIVYINGIPCVNEAVGKGVWLISLKEYLLINKNRKRKHYEINMEGKEFEMDIEALGSKYQISTFWKIIPFLFARKWFGKESKIAAFFTFKDDPYKYVCSELQGYEWKKKYISTEVILGHWGLSEKPHLLVPNDFLKYGFKPIDLNKYVNN